MQLQVRLFAFSSGKWNKILSMSSNLFVLDNSFLCDTLSQGDSQEVRETSNILIEVDNKPVDQMNSLDQIASILLSSPPTNSQIENSSLSHSGNAGCSALEVKTEEFQLSFDCYCNSFSSRSFDEAFETAAAFMHKSYSDDYFQHKQNFSFRPQLDRVSESPNSQNKILSSPETSFSSGEINWKKEKMIMQTRNMLSSVPSSTQKPVMEGANSKAGRYSAEERRERIDRYRVKRNKRNFNKTIKYECRKTLADNRPRIRGRFARNDEVGDEILTASMFHRCEDDDDDDLLWIDGFREDDDEGIARIGSFFDSFGSAQHQNYNC